jgi:hypothetical protein
VRKPLLIRAPQAKCIFPATPQMNDGFQQIGAVDLSTVANIATALTVLTAVIFGVIEMRHARKEREERAAFVAVQAILTPAWMDSMTLVQQLPRVQRPHKLRLIRVFFKPPSP